MENKTHWKKNNDPKYISGEDLKDGIEIGKGLAPEMVVIIDRFEDSETFDQNQNAKVIKTGFWLKDLNGNKIYKPVILNNTNADFCIKEFKSQFMEDWLNKPLVLYARPDKRHGYVARFKKYYPPAQISDVNALKLIESSKDLDDLKSNFLSLIAKTESLKLTLAPKQNENI
jgi:hypothetical protein